MTIRKWLVSCLMGTLSISAVCCQNGDRGMLTVLNQTRNTFYYAFAVTRSDSFPHWPISIREDSLRLNMLKDGERTVLALPSGYSPTDRITLQMYTLDTSTTDRQYHFRLLTASRIATLERDNWAPWVIDNLTIQADKAMKMEDVKRLMKDSKSQD